MKTPHPSGFSLTSPTARICDHLEAAARGRSGEPPPFNIGLLYGVHAAKPVRLAPRPLPISTFRPRWDATIEERKLTFPKMQGGVPVMKMTKAGPRAETFLVIVQECTVTVTVEHGTFRLRTSSRGRNVHDSRDDSRRPLALVRADLARLFPGESATILEKLASVLPEDRPDRPAALRERPVEEIETARRQSAARATAEDDLTKARRERKSNPPAKPEAPDFTAMDDVAFAAHKAKLLRESEEAMRALVLVRAGVWVAELAA